MLRHDDEVSVPCDFCLPAQVVAWHDKLLVVYRIFDWISFAWRFRPRIPEGFLNHEERRFFVYVLLQVSFKVKLLIDWLSKHRSYSFLLFKNFTFVSEPHHADHCISCSLESFNFLKRLVFEVLNEFIFVHSYILGHLTFEYLAKHYQMLMLHLIAKLREQVKEE